MSSTNQRDWIGDQRNAEEAARVTRAAETLAAIARARCGYYDPEPPAEADLADPRNARPAARHRKETRPVTTAWLLVLICLILTAGAAVAASLI